MQRCLGFFLLSLFTLAAAAPGVTLPDIIVTHLSTDGQTVTIHLQNQGPGRGHGNVRLILTRLHKPEPAVVVEVPSPVAVFDVARSRPIPLKSLDIRPDWTSVLLEVRIEAEGQARTVNKTFYEQIEHAANVIHNDSHPYIPHNPGLPDLVIDRVYYDGRYLRIDYRNRGRGRTGADFVISLETDKRKFPVNPYYRFRVPPPGERRTSGGYTPGKLGLKPGDTARIRAKIDSEGRVRETNSQNNTWTGTIKLSR